MGAIWAVISLLAVWLIYGLIASIFVKGVTSRDGLKLIFAGMLGGYLGGQIGIFMDVPRKSAAKPMRASRNEGSPE